MLMTTTHIDTLMNDVVADRIAAAEFAQSAAWVIKHMKQRQPVPILETVNLTVSSHGIRLRATDYETWREVSIGKLVGPTEQIQVAGRQLATLTKNLRGTASIAIRGNCLTFTLVDRVVSVPKAGEVSEWPVPPECAPAAGHTVSAAALKRAMTSIGTDDTLPMLTHMLCENGYLISSDRFRLTREESPGLAMNALIPRDVLRLFMTGTGDITLSEAGQWVVATRAGQAVIAKTMSRDTFPKVDKLIESTGAFDPDCAAVECDRKSLLAACGGDCVRIRRDDTGGLAVLAMASGEVVSTAQVSGVINADFPSVLMPTARLAAALKGCGPDLVRLCVPGEFRPVLVRSGGTEHLIMPLRDLR